MISRTQSLDYLGKKMVYLDYAASHPLLPETRKAIQAAWKNPANMQSSHAAGVKAALEKYALEEQVAELGHIHYNESYELNSEMEKKLKDGWTLFNHTTVNSTDGSIIPFPDQGDGWMHIDDTQGFCKVPLKATNWDSIAISFHKIGGPQGVGAIILKNREFSVPVRSGYELGTQNASLYAGCRAAITNFMEYQDDEKYQKWFLKLYAAEFESNHKWRVLSKKANSATNTIVLLAVKRPKSAMRGINSALQYLSEKGIMVSETSACSETVSDEVLGFYNLDKNREDLIRVSFGCFTKETDIDKLIKSLNTMETT
jgi:cysteine sulfinate desulfinase/cysteine desulfurase-like protein